MLVILEHINWDPVIFKVAGPLALRWYGLMYVLAFSIGYFVLRWLQRIGYLRVSVEDCTNIIIWGVLGTFIGGRLGHLFFYEFDDLVLNTLHRPLSDRIIQGLQVWKGGMSFHGGVIGVITAELIYARIRGLWFWNLGDACVHVVPIGVTSVRLGNYINGELYGRVIMDAAGKPIMEADKLPWYAMRFPTDDKSPGYDALREAMQDDWRIAHPDWVREQETWRLAHPDWAREHPPLRVPEDWSILPVKPEIWHKYEAMFYGRYPSQLLQFALEGFVLLVMIYILRRWCKRPGVIGSIMLIGYGVLRIPVEFIREPDAGVDPVKDAATGYTAAFLSAINMTMGQFLCVLLILFGTVQIFLFMRPKKSITGAEYPDFSRNGPPFGKPKLPADAKIGPPMPEEEGAPKRAAIRAAKEAREAEAKAKT